MSEMRFPLRERRLRALGVAPLYRRGASVAVVAAPRVVVPPRAAPATATPTPAAAAPPDTAIRRLALQPDAAELRDPAIHKMYTALTEAVSKAGLQAVRPCDVAADSTAAVMVFGAAPVPEGVPAVRILREDPLAVLHADRARKRRLWLRMQKLGRSGVA